MAHCAWHYALKVPDVLLHYLVLAMDMHGTMHSAGLGLGKCTMPVTKDVHVFAQNALKCAVLAHVLSSFVLCTRSVPSICRLSDE